MTKTSIMEKEAMTTADTPTTTAQQEVVDSAAATTTSSSTGTDGDEKEQKTPDDNGRAVGPNNAMVDEPKMKEEHDLDPPPSSPSGKVQARSLSSCSGHIGTNTACRSSTSQAEEEGITARNDEDEAFMRKILVERELQAHQRSPPTAARREARAAAVDDNDDNLDIAIGEDETFMRKILQERSIEARGTTTIDPRGGEGGAVAAAVGIGEPVVQGRSMLKGPSHGGAVGVGVEVTPTLPGPGPATTISSGTVEVSNNSSTHLPGAYACAGINQTLISTAEGDEEEGLSDDSNIPTCDSSGLGTHSIRTGSRSGEEEEHDATLLVEATLVPSSEDNIHNGAQVVLSTSTTHCDDNDEENPTSSIIVEAKQMHFSDSLRDCKMQFLIVVLVLAVASITAGGVAASLRTKEGGGDSTASSGPLLEDPVVSSDDVFDVASNTMSPSMSPTIDSRSKMDVIRDRGFVRCGYLIPLSGFVVGYDLPVTYEGVNVDHVSPINTTPHL